MDGSGVGAGAAVTGLEADPSDGDGVLMIGLWYGDAVAIVGLLVEGANEGLWEGAGGG